MLEQGRSVTLPAQLLLVGVRGPSGPPPQLDAVLVGRGAGERIRRDIERHPGALVLEVTEPITIRLRPSADSATFAPGSAFSVSIGGDAPDADRVVLNSVDASGLRSRDLVTLTPVGDEIEVLALTQTWEPELPPLATRARSAARVLFSDRDVEEGQVAVRVVVDGSASMRPSLHSGWLERVLELLMGASQLICSSRRVTAALCAQSWTDLGQDLSGFAAPVAAAASARVPAIGFRSALIPESDQATLTFVLTDAVPADLSPDRADALHLVLLAPPAQPLATSLPPGVAVTTIARDRTPRGSADRPATEELEPGRLAEVVASLLSDYCSHFAKGQR